MEQTSNLVAYLRTRSGGKEVLTPKQLEPILGSRFCVQALGVDQFLGFTLLLGLREGEECVNYAGFVANLIEVGLVDEVHEQALFGAIANPRQPQTSESS